MGRKAGAGHHGTINKNRRKNYGSKETGSYPKGARTELNEKVIDAYEQALQAQEQQNEAAEESETQGMAPSM